MEQEEQDVPLPRGISRVGIVCNLKSGVGGDSEAEYDNVETVDAIAKAIAELGIETELYLADGTLPKRLESSKADIMFNIAEGIRGRGREAMVPALLNMYGIPFTGSDEVALGIALDKALTKRLVASAHIRTPASVVVGNDGKGVSGLRFPVIIKPNAEGSSKGIHDNCVASDRKELASLLGNELAEYRQNVLVEEYIEGREFTVGLIGNGASLTAFEPMEICFKHPTQGSFSVYSFGVKKDYKQHISYKCPSDIGGDVREAMKRAAIAVFRLLDCRDFARVDFRVDTEGRVWFIEINPLPGLAPDYSDYPMLAGFCGVGYNRLVQRVLREAAARYGMTAEGGAD